MECETVLVTGASGGIGRELARRFAEEGCDLLLVARSERRLQELATELSERHGVKAAVFKADLALPGAAEELVRRIEQQNSVVDVLVNNAGFGLNGAMHELDVDRQTEMVRLNVGALVELTLRLLPGMIRRNRGGVLNLASTAAFQAGPFFGVYSATKSFVLSFTEALAEEMRGTRLHVSCLCPGPTETGFADQAGMNESRTFRWLSVADAASVARAGHRAFRRGRIVLVPGLLNKLTAFSGRHFPKFVLRRVIRVLFE